MTHNQKTEKLKKEKVLCILSGILLLIGIVTLLYPSVSSYLAKKQQEQVIIGYEQTIAAMDEEKLAEEWEKAVLYNRNPDSMVYEAVLNLDGSGVMGYIVIPKIDVRLPVYHGAEEESLKKGVGHVKETSLPVGGEGTHAVLTGHRGMPGAELFTRLDEVNIGDVFYIHILDRVLAYKVEEIQIVLPEEVSKLVPEKGADLVTLVTCTPYGKNTHRLLITASRTKNDLGKAEDADYENQIVGKGSGGDEIGLEKLKSVIVIILMAAGLLVFIYPYISHELYCMDVKRKKVTFEKEKDENSGNMLKTELLYQKLRNKNELLFREKQSNFVDAFSYEQNSIDLSRFGLEQNIIGFISIPDIDVELPIYLGANEENMKKGAVHLTETSYPIGGENTNCVIAAHRGYSKTAMFRDIEALEVGDPVYIENFREELEYEVVKTKVIAPSDIEEILIQKGKDMLTLITCHPYRHNHKRYVVFCEKR